MLLDIIRHADALDAPLGGSDADRPLSRKGRAQAEWLAQTLAALEDRPGLVIASTRVRALETARPIARALDARLIECETLARFEPEEVALGVVEEWSAGRGDGAHLAIVGHNPQLAMLVTRLTGEPPALKKGQCVRVALDAERPGTRGRLVDRFRRPKEL